VATPDAPVAQTDLSVIVVSGDHPVAGTPATLTFTVTNAGPSTAGGVRVRLNLTNKVTIASAPPGCAFSAAPGGPIAECPLPDLGPGASAPVVVTVQVPPFARSMLSATARVTGADRDPRGANNAAALARPILVHANLGLTATPAGVPANAGEPLTHRLLVRNAGPSAATGVHIDAPLPAGTAFVSASAGCTFNSGSVRCLTDDLEPGASRAVFVAVRLDELTSNRIAGAATVTSAAGEVDPNPADNAATLAVGPASPRRPRPDQRAPASSRGTR
jgi:uncharacterized repeat protein (TIGR01451 family)